MEAVNQFFTTLFAESGTLILLFIAAGLFLNVFGEIIKKTIYPRYTEAEIASGKVQRECPGWVGLIIGISLTLLFWAIAFYLWQMVCMKMVKFIMKRICPVYMTGKPRPPKPKKDIEVPAGYKLVKEDEDQTSEVL